MAGPFRLFALFAVLCFAVLSTTRGAPVSAQTFASQLLEKRVDYSPPITFPKKGTVWTAGEKVQVKWETDGIPDSAKGHRGKVLLGYRTKGSESEHLDVDHPLASNFKITRGHVSFRLPSTLKARNRYIVVLMGNSGNASPEFKILASSHEIKMQTAAEGKRGLVVAMDDDQDEE